MRNLKHRLAAVVGLGLAVIAPLALTIPANAAPIFTWADSSVVAIGPSVDQVTAIGGVYDPTPGANLTLGSTPTAVNPSVSDTIQLSQSGLAGTPSWSVQNQPIAGVTYSVSPSGLVSSSGTNNAFVGPVTLTIKVTDGNAAGLAEIVIGRDTNPSKIDLTLLNNLVTIPLAHNNNTTGQVEFLPTVAGVTEVLNNAPVGVSLAAGLLSGSNAVPGPYSGLSITASNAAGAQAVESFGIFVKGLPARPNLPYLYGGHASDPFLHNASRENVYVVLGGQPACLHFTIVGPGPINGHQGWVPGNLGLNTAVYGGLAAGHGNTVYYQPVTQNANGTPTGSSSCAGGPTTPIAGTHWGYVYFIAGH